MKTKMLFIAVAIVCSSLGFTSAQKERKVYSFCFAYNYSTKLYYVSPIVSGVKDSKSYFDADSNGLNYQWHKILDKYDVPNWVSNPNGDWGWYCTDYDEMDDKRTEQIKKYKSEGFSIRYIDDFYYRQKEKE